MTGTFAQPFFKEVAEKGGFELYDKPRGAPENVGLELKAIHPIVRTNPVTGWKSIFPVGGHVRYINGVTQEESDHLLQWFLDLVYKNHDLQVRLKWQNKNDIGSLHPGHREQGSRTNLMAAIWDNRSVFHTATFDYNGLGDRFGNRAVGLGEYVSPTS